MADDIQPASLADGWSVASTESVGLNGELIRGIGPHFESWTDANAHAILIARHGKLVYEHYFTGEDRAWGKELGRVTYDATKRHDLRSITKSVTSLLVGIAVDRGWLGDLDTPVFSFFPEHADLRTPEKDAITLRHLLTMSAGFVWNEDLPYSNPQNSERLMTDAPDQCRYVLEQPLFRPPGRAYNYNGGATMLLTAILCKAVGQPLDVLAQRELFDPLGISNVEWIRYTDGTPIAASGLRMRPRDLLKIGQVVLSGGAWQGRRIVSTSWIEESTGPHINGDGLYFYGYQWWLGRSLINREEVKWICGMGNGGQRLYVIPSRDMVVLAMAGLYDSIMFQGIVGEVVLRRYALQSAAG
ncbi:MAG TPA: serine hydrolase [Dongiaceae bacterium]|nr:serine hydrolase [Dongiaceae bacterium]